MKTLTTNTTELDKNSISLAGEFAVLSQLALRGYDANLTLGHTKGVDILISNPKTNKMFKMEVKTSYKNVPTTYKLFGHCLAWVMGEKNENIADQNLFYCFVNIEHPDYKFRFFIIPSAVVAKYVKEQHQYWISTRTEDVETTTMRQFRIGLEETKYNIDTPLARDYEDMWDLS